MISSKVDLTENREFSRGDGNRIIPLDSNFDELIGVTYQRERMSSSEYDRLRAWENIFGRRRHFTEVLDVFLDKREEEYKENIRTHCYRCGKELRSPWTMINGLCKDCNEKVMTDVNGRIPWIKQLSARERDIKDILFNSR